MLINAYNALRMEMGSGTIWGYFLQALPVALVVGIVYAVHRAVRRKKRGTRADVKSEILRCLFVCYLTGLCSLVILPTNFWLHIYDALFFWWWGEIGTVFEIGNFNLMPFFVLVFKGEITLGSWVKQMLVGNVAMLVPFGFFAYCLSEKCRGKRALAIAAITPPAMEILQLLFGRSFDVDDILCNFLGILLGFLLARGIRKTKWL